MNPGRIVLEKILSLLGGVLDSQGSHTRAVSFDGFESLEEGGGDAGPTHLGESLHLSHVGDRHQAAHDGEVDTPVRGAISESVVVGVIEKELRDQELDACVLLALHVVELGVEPGVLGVPFGVAGTGEADGRARADERGEFARSCESERGAFEMGCPFGWITAQSQDVVDVGFFEAAQHLFDVVPRRADAGQVRHAFDPDFIFDASDEIDR